MAAMVDICRRWSGIKTLAINGPLHDLNVSVGDSAQVVATGTTHKRYLKKLKAQVLGDTLAITYSGPPERAYNDNPYTELAMRLYYLREYGVIVVPDWETTPQLNIAVPHGTALDIDGLHGANNRIGDTQGPLHLRLDRFVSCDVGHMGDSTLMSDQNSHIRIRELVGNCRITTMGGQIEIFGGAIDTLTGRIQLGRVSVLNTQVKNVKATLERGNLRLHEHVGYDMPPDAENIDNFEVAMNGYCAVHAQGAIMRRAVMTAGDGAYIQTGPITEEFVGEFGAGAKLYVDDLGKKLPAPITAQLHVRAGAQVHLRSIITQGALKLDPDSLLRIVRIGPDVTVSGDSTGLQHYDGNQA